MNILLCLLLLVSFGRTVLADSLEEKFFYPQYSKRVSMDFKDATLNDVLKIFSQQSGMNFIAAQSIADRKVTLFMEKIPVEEALEKILDANGLTYEMKPGSDIFIVRPKPANGTVTRVYQLKYASVSSSKIRSTISPAGGGSSSAIGGGAAGGISTVIKAVLTSSGTVVEDSRTNSLIVTDAENQFPVIEATIAKMDVPVPQILIEVEMLDISKTTADLIGTKWGDTIFKFTGASKGSLLPFNQTAILQDGKGAAPTYTVGKLDFSSMNAVVNFLRTQTDTRSLARPRLLTLNNEPAEIKISSNEAIGVIKSTDTTASTGGSTETAERVPTGVFLTVTPQADLLTRDIVMAVAPKVIQARAGSIAVNGQTVKDAEERGSQSILKVHDGETIILGGLLRSDDTNIITKVPILGDIPFIGAAFRHKNKNATERELVIFITPHIIDNSSTEGLKGSGSLDRIDMMNKVLSSMEKK